MGSSNADISRRTFDETNRYVQQIIQQGVPVVDSDVNESQESFYTQLRRAISNSIGDGARGDGFLVSAIPADNNFTVNGGDLGDEGPETLYVKGHQAQLFADETFVAADETAAVSVAFQTTGVANDTLVDTAANFTPGALVGRTLVPNQDDPGTTFTIIANTANTIQVGATMAATPGKNYQVLLTTPGADRLDLVYVDVYLDEIDTDEDLNLKHTIDTIQVSSTFRRRVIQTVRVDEGVTLPVTLASGYTDADGNRHVLLPLATIAREGGNPQITAGMITDLRQKIFTLEEIEDRFVNAAGDTMTGTLVMAADIEMSPGQRVTGICVIDGDALCPEVVQQRHFDRDEHLLGDGGEIPTFSEVNNPLDPKFFNVHDNRYFTKTEIENLIGTNTVNNGLFDEGFEGWENAIPQPLSGGPSAEAATSVIVSLGLCATICGTDCACRTLQVTAIPGSRVCFVCPLRQELALRCGGKFLLVQTLCVSKGDEAVRPYFLLDMWSSCQFVGTMRVDMFDPPADQPNKAGVELADGFTRLEQQVNVPQCVDQVFLTLCYDIAPQTPLETGEGFPSSPLPPSPAPSPAPPSPSPSTGSLEAKCEVGPEGLEWNVCSVQMRRITGVEAEFTGLGGNTTAEPVIESCDVSGGQRTIRFTPGKGQVSLVLERLEEFIGGAPTGMFPTHFPGVVVDPDADRCVDEVDVLTQPVSSCQCLLNCNDPGGALAAPHCFLYGPVNGNLGFGCPEITDETLGVSAAAQIDTLLVRIDLEDAPVDFLQLTGADEDNTAVKFTLGRVTTGVAPDQNMRVICVDDEGRRVMYGFMSEADAATKTVTIPLADFQRLDAMAFDWTQVTAVYLGYSLGFHSLECQFAVDNLRFCTKTDASTYSFGQAASVAPHDSEEADEDCVSLEDFGDTEDKGAPFDRITCSAAFPLGTTPPDDEADFCAQVAAIAGDGEGSGAVSFEVSTGVRPAPVGFCRDFSVGALDISAEPTPKFSVAVETNRTGTNVWLVATSGNGGKAIEEFTLTAGTDTLDTDFAIDAGLPDTFDPTDITQICLYFGVIEAPQIGDIHATDNWQIDRTGGGSGPTLVEGWNDADQAALEARLASGVISCGYGVGLALANTFAVGSPFSEDTTPLVALNADRTMKIAYWGQNEATVRDADVVLVSVEFKDDALVGQNGNGGVDPNTGLPIAGAEAQLARDTGAMFGKMAFAAAPFSGCRNIWCDTVYLDQVECEGATPSLDEFDFFDTGCACVLPATMLDVSGPVTDECLYRILPDDEFGVLPDDYPQAIGFEYCAIPRLDRNNGDGNDYFDFIRETPECARQDGAYLVKVTLRAKQDAISIDWADTLPAGHTLLSGALSATAIALACVGDIVEFEYVVKTPGPGSPDVTITGDAELTGQPVTNIVVESDPIEISENCPTLCYRSFGSQDPHSYGKVFWAGGGRPDPSPAAEDGLYVTVYAGPGSAGASAREAFIITDTTVPNSAASHTFRILPAEIGEFAVDRPVWVFNRCFPDNPARNIHVVDIETEEALADPDEEVTGLYGTITAIDAALGDITVTFDQTVVAAGGVDFTTAARATLMVAPSNSKGFYWEANEELADLVKNFVGVSQGILRFDYRFWNASKYPCPAKAAATFVCDGDGETTAFFITGDTPKEIINPRDWLALGFTAPVGPHVPIKANLSPGDTDVSVCDICIFGACDIIQIVDDNCSGQDGNGPGFVGSVVSTTPTGAETCGTDPTAEGDVTFSPAIPTEVVGCAGFTGFTTADDGTAFVKPDVCRYAFSPTRNVFADGTPVEGPNFVGVDFATGDLTFDPSVKVTNPLVCYRQLEPEVTLPAQHGVYFLVGIDQAGRRSPPSKPILVGGLKESAPPKGYKGTIKLIRQDSPGPPFTDVVFERVVAADSNSMKVLCTPDFHIVSGAVIGVNGVDVGPPLGIGDPATFDKWYHVFIIGSLSVGLPDAGLLSLDPDNPVLPPGYDCFCRIWSVRTDAGGDIIAMRKVNGVTKYENAQFLASGAGGGAPTPVSAATRVPPTAEVALLHAEVGLFGASAATEQLRFFIGTGNPPAITLSFTHRIRLGGGGAGGAPFASDTEFAVGLSPAQVFEWNHTGAAVASTNVWVVGFVDDVG